MTDIIKSIALYLPQYHPVPENDAWWGKGFTEWTNVTRAKPLFKGHWQPRLPADLGFYDLRVPEARQAQADLAKQYGIYGFCYWHYWFGGKRMIERPFTEVVQSGQPDFPFCIGWANQTWSGTWHGLSNKKVLIEQTYPGREDDKRHFYSLLEAFQDPRYIEVNGKKLVFIFRPMDIPDPNRFVECWQELAVKEGLNGLHFVGMHMLPDWNPQQHGYDAMVQYWILRDRYRHRGFLQKLSGRLSLEERLQRILLKKNLPEFVSYGQYVECYPNTVLRFDEYPLVYTNWDNTPRSGKDGWMFQGFTPERFEELCYKAFKATENKPEGQKIVLLKSWNEWAEGNYLEPDQRYGHACLQAFKSALERYQKTSKEYRKPLTKIEVQ
ncbi:glycosyltransferase WbsX family protein [Flavisolibacter nicotianae]|uniref:glycosyltransferase WbsX family protein n=1 Tax=Flavisolibacter nicotianae TaxID=2364882 RepID=UPI000EADEB56|nr:glycoside hydrolase family 99-like domain-containing protein [Flavisolibacter nicotianae]